MRVVSEQKLFFSKRIILTTEPLIGLRDTVIPIMDLKE